MNIFRIGSNIKYKENNIRDIVIFGKSTNTNITAIIGNLEQKNKYYPRILR